MKRRSLLSKIGDKLGTELLLPGFERFSLSMDVNGDLFFSGRCSMETYSDSVVAIRFAARFVTVEGSELRITVLTEKSVSLSGAVRNISIAPVI